MWTWSLKGSAFSAVWGLLRGVSPGLECWWLSKVDFVLAVFCVHLSEELTVTLRLNRALIFIPYWVSKVSSVLGPYYYYFLVLCILFKCPNCVKQRVCILFQKSCNNNHFVFWLFSNLILHLTSFNIRSIQGFLWCQVPGIRRKGFMCVLMASRFQICV